MNKIQLEKELAVAYAELKQLEDMYNLCDADFTDVITYRIKAQNCLIAVLKKRIGMDRLLEDIKKESVQFGDQRIQCN